MAAAMLLCATWLLIGLMFFLYNSRGTGAPTYLAFAWSTGCLYFPDRHAPTLATSNLPWTIR